MGVENLPGTLGDPDMKARNTGLAVALILFTGASAGVAAAAEDQVVAQDVPKLQVPGKVSGVVWTRRSDSCTLQVVLHMPVEFQHAAKRAANLAAAGAGVPLPTPKLPQVQVWMLRADGTVIPRIAGTAAFPAAVKASDGVPLEVKYSYPISAAQEAVAAALVVDGAYYIAPLRPF
jgi:hypothetical protein